MWAAPVEKFMSRIASTLIALGILFFAVLPLAAPAANPAYDKGVSLYNQKNYRAAAQQFEAAMQAAPDDANVIYYCALCAQLSNNRARARQLFEYVTQRFPQSRVAGMAQTALSGLSSLSNSTSSSAGESSASSSSPSRQGESELASVPDLVRVPFEKQGNDITVMVQVNGRSVPFILDTGAAAVAVGRNHLKDWGISSSEAKETSEVGGVGDGKAKAWIQRVDLKLGQIFRKNFPVMVMDHMPTEPLLGQTFLRAFNVSVDDNSRMVLLAKKGGTASRDIAHRSYSGIEVPFTRGPGGHMMVMTRVNGKPFIMMFDTGCERTCFAAADWKKLGFEIPSNAQQGISRGVLGDTQNYVFNTESIVLVGTDKSIEQQNSPCSVTEGAHDSLLGMSFYGKFKYTIDAARNVIIFENVDR
jgi:clan AA aspartic protease (TIGR02281 family)